MLDPDVPILKAALIDLQHAVRAGGFTQQTANDILGSMAESLVEAEEFRQAERMGRQAKPRPRFIA